MAVQPHTYIAVKWHVHWGLTFHCTLIHTHFGEGCGKEVCIRTVCTFALHLVNILSSIQVCSCTQAEGAFSLSVSYAHTMLVGTQPYLFGSGGIRDNLVL